MKQETILLICVLHSTVVKASWNFAGENIAKGRRTEQAPGTLNGYWASKAVDGNTNTDFSAGSCSHTRGRYNTKATWTVTLDAEYTLKGIRIYSRSGFRYRHRNFKAIGKPSYTVLHDDRTANPQLYDNEPIDLAFDSNRTFSSVIIEVPPHTGWPDGGRSFLQLCEVQIFAVENDCTFPSQGNQLVTKLNLSTGFLNSEKGLVSTGTQLEFACDGYYTLEGSTSVTCQVGGVYSTDIPSCAEKRCSKPSDIMNGYYKNDLQDSYAIEATAIWTCYKGYTSAQKFVRKCLWPSGEWSGEQPVCTRIQCPFPSQFSNGYLFNYNAQYTQGPVGSGTLIHVFCYSGFSSNSANITCNENGQWSVFPACVQVLCDSLEKLTGGYYIYFTNGSNEDSDKENYEYGTLATAVCNDTLFVLSNDTETNRRCGQDGAWSGNAEPCVALCLAPKMMNGRFNNSEDAVGLTAGSLLTPACDEGYGFESPAPQTVECQNNHTWQPTIPACIAIEGGTTGSSTMTAAAAGGGAGAAVAALAVAVLAFILIKRRRAKKPLRNKNSIEDLPPTDAFENVIYKNTDVYENSEATIEVPDKPNTYYSFNDVHKAPESSIRLENLVALVMDADTISDRFRKEFQGLPEGMTQQHEMAKANLHKNRYKGLYAYDVTRVILDVWDTETDTDYINACYIHGYNTPRAYIASQGPVDDVLKDFWRMVWQQNCTKIVMLTNLMEAGKMKCKQYWPGDGTETYGRVSVTLENTEVYANFLIRTLTVIKDGEHRQVLQFHFTSWPDKDVPYFCSSLVHFRNKVKAAHTIGKGPIVVHCSAGIGRTGTFIAIDFLVHQAERLGYVDVAGCVSALRRQRVNMVQTEKQYVFVHLALVEILVLKTSVVQSATFEATYKDLTLLDKSKNKRKLEVEFEILCKILPVCEDSRQNRSQEQNEKTKIRYSNIILVREFMPSLSRPGRFLFGEYINAAFLPLYKESDALIVTQTPLETTVRDFWNLVLHQEVHTIVMMNHVTELSEGEKYWPDMSERRTFEDGMQITCKGIEKQNEHQLITLALTTKDGVRDVKLIQFEKWEKGKLLPEDPIQVLSALDLVEAHQRQTGNKPFVVHCMDGVEKSGLFCVIAALLDRLKVEQEVAISQVIEEMRNRRPNVIPNIEQFQFCHEVVMAFLKQFETYSNFEFHA